MCVLHLHRICSLLYSGVKSVEKREGGGAHNWGTFEDDIKAEDDKVLLLLYVAQISTN